MTSQVLTIDCTLRKCKRKEKSIDSQDHSTKYILDGSS